MADSTDPEQVLKSETRPSHTFSLAEGSGGHILSHHLALSRVVYVCLLNKTSVRVPLHFTPCLL